MRNWEAICQSQVSAKIVKSEANQAKSGSSGCLTYTDVKRAKISSYLTSTTDRLCSAWKTLANAFAFYLQRVVNTFAHILVTLHCNYFKAVKNVISIRLIHSMLYPIDITFLTALK